MEYQKIVSVTGLPGLYEIVTSKSDGAIVRGLDEKTTKFVSSRLHNLSHLESIEVYTVQDNVNLAEIFQLMEKSASKLPDEKDAKAVKAYFEKVFPDLDFDRVYHSDMKKMIRWYSLLKTANVEIKLPEYDEGEAEDQVEEPVAEVIAEVVADEKPVKKAKAKKEDGEVATKQAKKENGEVAAKPAKKEDGEVATKPAKKEDGEVAAKPAKKK